MATDGLLEFIRNQKWDTFSCSFINLESRKIETKKHGQAKSGKFFEFVLKY